MTIQEPSEAPEHPADELTVVGVGASAGGLEALSDLLQHLPPAPKMAFVLIQHLDPHHESALPELLSKQTAMRVVPVHNEMRLQPERVYVIAPNSLLRVRHGWLRLEARPPDHFKPIDSFFHSLAEDFRERAIAVSLSGTATDGTLGLKHIKAEGGLTFAQDESAKFDNMPRSAVAAGAVDFVLPPKRIAEELVAIAQRPDRFKPAGARAPSDALAFERLLLMLRRHSGVDFTQYKQPTIARRFNRRMVVRKTGSIDEYIQILQKEPGELDALFNALLINVPDFFRDPDVFEAAKRVAFSSLVQSRKQPHTLRVWIPGCSTGEEVYSMAITITELLEAQELGCAIQMFGTDVSERTIEVARKGLYNESSVLNVSPERIRRFFVRSDGGYQVSR